MGKERITDGSYITTGIVPSPNAVVPTQRDLHEFIDKRNFHAIAGYNGIGKTSLCRLYPDMFMDGRFVDGYYKDHTRTETNPDFIAEYRKKCKLALAQGVVILDDYEPEVIEVWKELGLSYMVVIPNYRDVFITRFYQNIYKHRKGDTEGERAYNIDNMERNWYNMVNAHLTTSLIPQFVVQMLSGETLLDFLVRHGFACNLPVFHYDEPKTE